MLKLYLESDFIFDSDCHSFLNTVDLSLKLIKIQPWTCLDMCFALGLWIMLLSSAGLCIFKVKYMHELCTRTSYSSTWDKGKGITLHCNTWMQEDKFKNGPFFLKVSKATSDMSSAKCTTSKFWPENQTQISLCKEYVC